MALINCPYCNKEISDKAKVCVGCGFQFVKDDKANNETQGYCPECNAEVNGLMENCSNCGYPLNNNEQIKSKKCFKKKWILILAVCLIFVISIIVTIFSSVRTENYYIEICSAVDEIMAISADVENVGNQICNVWNNAIWDKNNQDTAKYTSNAKDFNEALSNLFADEEFIEKITNIRNKQAEIDVYLGKLKNPPRKFEDAYDEFKEVYYAYSDYTDFVISCKGSYNTYTEDLSKKSAELLENYREIKVELLGE